MSEETKGTSKSKPTDQGQVPKETGVVMFYERKAGDQGILLRPVGSHQTDPFTPQDVSPLTGNQPSSLTTSAPQTTDSPISSTTQGSTEGE